MRVIEVDDERCLALCETAAGERSTVEPGVPGELPAAAYDSFVRDTVTFLEYVAEPTKAKRQALGVWVILFLLMFTAFTWFLYKEYWKDVK